VDSRLSSRFLPPAIREAATVAAVARHVQGNHGIILDRDLSKKSCARALGNFNPAFPFRALQLSRALFYAPRSGIVAPSRPDPFANDPPRALQGERRTDGTMQISQLRQS